MSEAKGPLGNSSSRLDFPNIVSSEALKQQAFYNSAGEEPSPDTVNSNVEALASLVQELNQQNHELLSRISVLDADLAQYRQMLNNSGDTQPDSVTSVSDETLDDTTQEQVTQLLNHLEFTQQANQRQNIRIESLVMQLEDSQTRITQLETENKELQQRYSDRTCRINQLDEECHDLRLRLQRQQQYTLQFKAALEKCLEVPPPSYSYIDGPDDFTLVKDEPETEGATVATSSLQPREGNGTDNINWFVQPLFPKVQQIQSWAMVQQIQPQTQPKPTVNTEPSYKTSEDKFSDQPHLLLPQEPRRDRPSTTPAVFQNFPKPRFQSTLLNLAHQALPSPTPSSQPLDMPSFESIESFLPADAPAEAPPDIPDVPVAPAPNIREEKHGDGEQNVFPQEQAAPQDETETVTQFTNQELEKSGVSDSSSSTQIPPFPSSPPAFDSDNATDAKLWQSLVDLIDLSAADGLNLAPKTETETSSELDSDPEAIPASTMLQSSDAETEPGTKSEATVESPRSANAAEVAPTLSSSLDSPTSEQVTTARRKVSHRSIDLPSFPRVAVSNSAGSSNSAST